MGCDPNCDLLIAGQGVAGKHAHLILGPAGLLLRANGMETRVNGKLVREASLADKDEVQFGEVRLVVEKEKDEK